MLRGLGVERGLETWVGNTVLVFYVVSFVMNPIWGGVADHYGRKIMMLRATLGMGSFMCCRRSRPRRSGSPSCSAAWESSTAIPARAWR